MGFKIDLVLENSCKNSNTEIHKTDLKFWVMPAAREIFFRGYFFVFLLGSAIKNLGLFSKSPGDFKMETMDF